MAMSISKGQKLQPFTGNGDISMRVKILLGETNNYMISGFCFVKSDVC